MELIRTIHPVGQGGFYSETFLDDNDNEVFNMVYDCGGVTSKSFDTISLMQVPHHDSKNNYNDYLYNNVLIGFISAGQNNRYNHPHKETLKNLIKQGCCVKIVTEEPLTKLVQRFSF